MTSLYTILHVTLPLIPIARRHIKGVFAKERVTLLRNLPQLGGPFTLLLGLFYASFHFLGRTNCVVQISVCLYQCRVQIW